MNEPTLKSFQRRWLLIVLSLYALAIIAILLVAFFDFSEILLAAPIGVTLFALVLGKLVSPSSYYLRQGQLAFARGDNEAAIKNFTLSLQANPDVFAARIARIWALTRENKPELALQDCDLILQKHPKHVAVLMSRAAVYLKLNDKRRALGDANRAVELDPISPDTLGLRALIHLELENYQQVIQDGLASIKLRTGNPLVYHHLGDAYSHLKEYEKALVAFTQAIKYEPKNYEHYFDRAIVQLDLKNYEQSLTDSTRVIELNLQAHGAYTNRGIAFMFLDRFDEARENYQQSLAVKENPNAYNNLGSLDLLQGNSEAAILNFEQALDLMPDSANYMSGLAVAYFGLGQVGRARELWQKVIKKDAQFNDIEWLLNQPRHPSEIPLVRRFHAAMSNSATDENSLSTED